MSEQLKHPATILELTPNPAVEGQVKFRIAADTKGEDVLATLVFVNPDPEERRHYIDALLQSAADRRVLRHRKIEVENSSESITDQATIARFIKLGHKPTVEDVACAYEALYGEDAVLEKLGGLFSQIVDEGYFAGTTVIVMQRNEFVTAEPEQINLEMQNLVHQYRRENGF